MTTLVIFIEVKALISTGSHGELLQDFLFLFVHVKTIIGRSKKTWNKKWCNGTDHSAALLKYMSSHLLVAQELTCWLRLIEFKWAERCVALYAVVASIKPERYVNLLLKMQQRTLESKESKLFDARKMSGQRKPMTRYWWPSPRRSGVNLLVATSQLKKGWSDEWKFYSACGLTFVRN